MVLAASAVPVDNSPAQAAEKPSGGSARTVTLITGDRVTLAGGAVTVTPGPGRSGIPMATSTVGGRTRVVPADALPLLRADKLDARLFDVTGLVAAGYDDRRADLPLIAGRGATVSGARVRALAGLGATAIRTPKKNLARDWKAGTGAGKLWLDAKGRFTAAAGVQQIGAPQAWQAGLTGKGVTVGVIDSGVDVTHPDLAPVVAAQADFSTGTAVTGDVHDIGGHGTAVASILAGRGTASDGRYRGVAPDVRLVSAKAGDFDTTESAVIAAMEWTAGTQRAKIVNMSLGFPNTPGTDPLEAAVDEMTEKYGTLFVVAAGNSGKTGNDPANGDDYKVESPADAADALSVGAVDYHDRLADFSSRGPGLDGESIKPEITAPGVDITHAVSRDAGPGPYGMGYGTSYAAPHVAGAAAVLSQKHPDWTPAQLKAGLMGSAQPSADLGAYAQGAGRVDVARAVRTAVVADPPSLSLGRQTAGKAITRTVSYRNYSTRPLTLTLRVSAPFAVNATSLTVPAGGTASARVTAPATLTGGPHTGQLTAAAGDQVVTTPVAVVRDRAVVDLDLHVLGLDGLPSADHYTQVIGLDTPYLYDSLYHYPWTADINLQVPSGRYAIVTQYFAESADGTYISASVTQPSVTVTGATDVTVDTRKAKPVTATVPDAGARFEAGSVASVVRTATGWASYATNSYGGSLRSAQLGADSDAVNSVVRLAYSSDSGAYHLAWPFAGGVPDGLTGAVTARDLAVETGEVRRQMPGSTLNLTTSARLPGVPLPLAPLTTEASATRFFTTFSGVSWNTGLYEWRDEGDYEQVWTAEEPRPYEAGRKYSAVYNAPVIAPCPTGGGIGWTGERLSVRIAMNCDSAGHPGTTIAVPGGLTGGTTLFRDGEQVAFSDVPGEATLRVPQAQANYRLRLEQGRSVTAFTSSTASTVDWTFTDPAVVSELGTVRISPITSGVRLTPPSGTRSVTLEVSYDDGATWKTATVRRDSDGTYRATLTGTGYASLRVAAKGSASSVTETVIRALPPA
uniref:S8 family peptidase n=1 Tax=Paractinoplanes polyasparticus TaxID=2856853 RepID=UPI001C85D7AF|nr:S8 family serine peptidase [Actinoplanes polyasparticus]